MAVTPNFSIPLYTTSDTAKLDTLLNGQATAIDTNLKTAIDAIPKFYRVGLDSGRTSPVGWTPAEGYKYYSTDTNREWFHDGTTWLSNDPGVYLIRPTGVTGGTVAADGSITVTSGVSAVQVNGVFTTRFRRYQIRGSLTTPSNGYLAAQLSSGGTPVAGSSYAYQDITLNGTGAPASFSSTNANFPIGRNLGTEQSFVLDFTNPATAVRTMAGWDVYTYVAGKTLGGGYLATASAYDGFTILSPGAPSISGGNIAIYGLA